MSSPKTEILGNPSSPWRKSCKTEKWGLPPIRPPSWPQKKNTSPEANWLAVPDFSGLLPIVNLCNQALRTFVCYDDLDLNACQSGAITFHGDGYAALWEHCREKDLQVIGDMHTHPGGHVGQSEIDQRHPMIPLVGHTAIIVPNFARTPWWSLKPVGMYEYLGNFNGGWTVAG